MAMLVLIVGQNGPKDLFQVKEFYDPMLMWSTYSAMDRNTFHWTQSLIQTSFEHFQTSTNSESNLYQCLTKLVVNNFFLMSNLNLHLFSLEASRLILFIVSFPLSQKSCSPLISTSYTMLCCILILAQDVFPL